ncbi:MAG: hypothetical protein EPN68_09515 [Rhodanobacter sp.]|jgi:hypothetical protein|nr:MAG: hypothetical protein EPN68_09515 [Rhodanobacter sp.]
MSLYQISYDLRKQRNYDALYERIKAYGNWCHALESSWVISTPQSAVQVRDNLRQVLDSDDGLLVTRLSGQAAWYGLSETISTWLKTQLESAAA